MVFTGLLELNKRTGDDFIQNLSLGFNEMFIPILTVCAAGT